MTIKKHGPIISTILVLLGYLIAGFASVFGHIFLTESFHFLFSFFISYSMCQLICTGIPFCLVFSLYFLALKKAKKFNEMSYFINTGYVLVVCIVFTVIFMIAKSSMLHPLMNLAIVLVFPLFPMAVILSIINGTYQMILVLGVCLIYSIIFTALISKQRKIAISSLFSLVCAGLCFFTYFNSPNYKYKNQNHGFTYMNGFSSTDLSDYHVYSDSGKLAELGHEPEFMIENSADMPILDGAEACYPVYAAVAKTLYQDIAEIESTYANAVHNENGSIVTFYNTAVAFERLVAGDVDMFFGAKPSASQIEYAQEAGVELVYTPIGKEAFVFFVEEDNPIDDLTADQIRSIYHGDITNWKEVGGNNEKIIAFQRPERSGSQSMMVYFMGDVSLKEPLTYEMEYSMMGIVEQVAEYQNEEGAIGYSFRYFLEELNQVDNVKMLKVDGVIPSNTSLQDGTYPLTATLYCITLKDSTNPYVQKVIDFLLSEDGQYLIEETGYSPLY